MRKRKLLLCLLIFFLLSNISNAYKPIVQIGKPALNDIAYSPDGRYLGVLNRAYLELMDPETMETVARFDAPNEQYNYWGVAFSPDSSVVAIYEYSGIQIWDIATQTIIETIYDEVREIEFSPDGKYIAYTKDDSVFLWDVKQRKVVKELTGDPLPHAQSTDENVYENYILDIEFFPNGKTLAVGSTRKNIALWDIESAKISGYIETKYARLSGLIAISHDGSLVAVHSGNSGEGIYAVDLLNVVTGEKKYLFARNVNSLAFTIDDKKLIVGEGDGYLRIVDIENFPKNFILKQVVKNLSPYNYTNFNRTEHIAVSPDGKRIATVLNDSRLYIWDAHSFEKIKMLYGWRQTFLPVAYLPKANHIVTGMYSSEIVLWDAKTGKPLAMREFYMDVEYIKVSPDGKTFAIALNGPVLVYDGSTLRLLHSFNRYGHSRALDFSPSGRYLISNGWMGTYVWDVKTGDEIKFIRNSWEDYPVLLFTPDEKQFLMIPPEKDETEIWDIEKGTIDLKYKGSGPTAKIGNDFMQARKAFYRIEIYSLKARKLITKIPIIDHDPYWWQSFFWNTKIHPKGEILASCSEPNKNPYKWDFFDPWTGKLIKTDRNIEDIDFAGDKHIFIRNSKQELGLYLLSDFINDVNPEDKEITQFARIKENQLLPNYPNPFNPETWIPYELANDANVLIKIYTTGGQIVRTLELGHKQAGVYKDRENSAYWDGKDNYGQLVGSGLYFYSIQAGDFSETKKMVLIR